MIKLNQEELRHLLIGATFFSTGGGGSLTEGIELIKEVEELTLFDIEEVNPKKYCATSYLVGSVNPPSLGELKKQFNIKLDNSSELVIKAFKHLQNRLNKKIDYVIPIELGGYNTAVSLLIASQMNLPIIDADLTGRSAPEMYQTSYFIGNISPSPASVVNLFDEKFFVENLNDYKRFDDYLRSLVINSYGYDVGVANFPLSVIQARDYFIKNTMTQCLKIGSLLAEGKSYIAIEKAKGKVLFKGRLIKEVYWEKSGFTEGYVLLENKYKKFRIEYKNEILVSYLDNKIIASVPDLIGVITTDGRPVINTEFPKKKELIVYTIPTNDIWNSPKGRKVFNLSHFGYENR